MSSFRRISFVKSISTFEFTPNIRSARSSKSLDRALVINLSVRFSKSLVNTIKDVGLGITDDGLLLCKRLCSLLFTETWRLSDASSGEWKLFARLTSTLGVLNLWMGVGCFLNKPVSVFLLLFRNLRLDFLLPFVKSFSLSVAVSDLLLLFVKTSRWLELLFAAGFENMDLNRSK